MNSTAATAASRWTDDLMLKRVAKRYAAERRFRFFGLAAVSLSVAFLAFLLITMAWQGPGRLYPHRGQADDRLPAIGPDSRPCGAARPPS